METAQLGTNGRPEAGKKQAGGEILAQAASAYMEAHYREKFSLRKMADALYVNGSYLLRVFKKYRGCTPLVYHNLVRCRHAKELLARTGDGVSEIGESVGFVSSAHFSHVFRKTEGCTPTEYRLRHRAFPESGQECPAPPDPASVSGQDPD